MKMQSTLSPEGSLRKRSSLVMETTESMIRQSQELTVFSATTAAEDEETAPKDEEKTTLEGEKAGTEEKQVCHQIIKKKLAAFGFSRSDCVSHRDRLRRLMAFSGWRRKVCEGVVMSIVVTISLCAASVPAVLYFSLVVRTCCHDTTSA